MTADASLLWLLSAAAPVEGVNVENAERFIGVGNGMPA